MLGELVNWDYQWGQIVGRAWSDEDFKTRLLADPAGVLKDYDLALPAGFRIEVLDNPQWSPPSTDEVMYLILPARPTEDELSEEELCSVGAVGVDRCGCEWCHKCHHCHHCEWCEGCHHPEPEEE